MLFASTSLVFMTARFTQRSDGCCLLERLRVHRPGPYGPRLTQQMALRSERNGTSRRYDSVLALSPTETVCRTRHPTLSPRAPAAQEGRGDKFSDRLVVSLPVMVFRENQNSAASKKLQRSGMLKPGVERCELPASGVRTPGLDSAPNSGRGVMRAAV